MSHDDSKRQGSSGFVQAGVGHACGYQCDYCRRRTTNVTGRKRTRLGWMCAGCVKAKEAKVAA
jgi:hypothetical protein